MIIKMGTREVSKVPRVDDELHCAILRTVEDLQAPLCRCGSLACVQAWR